MPMYVLERVDSMTTTLFNNDSTHIFLQRVFVDDELRAKLLDYMCTIDTYELNSTLFLISPLVPL